MKSLKQTYKWKHLNTNGEVEEVKDFRDYEGDYTALNTRHGYDTKGDAFVALTNFITGESQYSYNEFILVETFRVYFD